MGSPRRAPPELRGFDFLPRQDFHLLVHGYLQATHNAAERALRIVALGRKNFLFVGHAEAGQNLAVLYSLMATCEEHGVDPHAYLTDVLLRVDDHPIRLIDELLPDLWSAPNTV